MVKAKEKRMLLKVGYSYSPGTGEYIGTEYVYLEKATGKYPCAANVVFTPPPACGEHEKQIWDGTDWKIVPDHRGETWYKEDGSYGGQIEALGEVIEILKEPPEHIDHVTLAWDKEDGDWRQVAERGYKFEDGKLRELTSIERIEAGLDPMPEGAHIVDGEIVFFTQEELLEQGKITMKEYNEYIRQEREAEYRESTDKIGMMVLRGEASLEEWKAAIQAVKDKWPYKEA